MIGLFNVPSIKIDTAEFSNLLHDPLVGMFEKRIADYVGAKYACGVSSATNAIFLMFVMEKNIEVQIPSLIPPVVANAIITSGNKVTFTDDIDWVGNSYVLHDFGNYRIIDSAQKISRNQFVEEANDEDLMFFSFYPTKPIGSCDGGMVVSNDKNKIEWLREAVMNGMTFSENNWERKIKFPGYKMYLNSIQAHIANRNLDLLDNKKKRLSEIRDFYNNSFGLKNESEHLFRIRVKNRDETAKKLKGDGIMTGIHYDALHLNPIYAKVRPYLPKSENEALFTLSIPYHECLADDEVRFVIQKIKHYAILD